MKTPALTTSHVTAGILLLLAPVAAAGAVPVPVSPGGPAGGLAKDTCPAFSWSQGGRGGPYELVVYPVTAEGELGPDPALAARLPAGAQSWTPPADRCLQAGSRYAWTLREVGTADWSEPALFEVALPSRVEVAEALETLRRYLDGGEGRRGAGSESTTGARDLSGSGRSEHPERALALVEGIGAIRTPAIESAIGELSSLEAESHSGIAAIHVVEPSTAGSSQGVWAESASTQGQGVFGKVTATSGATTGVYGWSDSIHGRGVFGVATATTGFTSGVYGLNDSTQGWGVLGIVTGTSGITYGVSGESLATQGRGVSGLATATTGFNFGVAGETRSTQGRGVFGLAAPTSGFTRGVWGQSNSTQGVGVYGSSQTGVVGSSTSSAGVGVLAQVNAPSGGTYGVWGQNHSTQGIAIFGQALGASGINYGVYGAAVSPDGYAGYFAGDVEVTGTLTKSMGTFKIDHPLDPANRFLSHSFVESPDMKNVYDGVVRLDEEGAAWVELPEYFGALNRDFRYQLTALYRPAPGLYVASGIAANRFRIAGGEAGMEVSWQVTGVRQDAYAERKPIVVEEDKGELRGRFLHPEAHGQPAELAIGWVEPAEVEVATSTRAPNVSNPQEATSQSETESIEGDRR